MYIFFIHALFLQDGDPIDILPADQATQAVEPQKRITTPYMTKYERARVLGTRALQIAYVSSIYNYSHLMKTSANHVISFDSSQNFVLSKVFGYQLKLKKETVVGASISFCYIHGNVFKRMMFKIPNLNFTAFSLTFLPI